LVLLESLLASFFDSVFVSLLVAVVLLFPLDELVAEERLSVT